MSFSEQGYKIASELVWPRILEALDKLAPGTGQKIINEVAAEASQGAEKTGDHAFIEAVQIAAKWEKPAEQPSNQAQASPHDAVTAAHARLALHMVTELLFVLEKKDIKTGYLMNVLNPITLAVGEEGRAQPGPLVDEMRRVLDSIRDAQRKLEAEQRTR